MYQALTIFTGAGTPATISVGAVAFAACPRWNFQNRAMNKETTCNRATPLYWAEDDALQRLAKKLGKKVSETMRAAFFQYLAQYEPDTAKELLEKRERVARELARFSAGIAFIVGIFGMEAHAALTHQDQPEFRRVRIVRRFGRREEAL